MNSLFFPPQAQDKKHLFQLAPVEFPGLSEREREVIAPQGARSSSGQRKKDQVKIVGFMFCIIIAGGKQMST